MDARVRHTIASILLLGPLLPVAAQEQPATTNAEQLQTVVVTGTLIKRADFDTPSPLQVITADDLKNSGYTSISDVLRSLSANGQGTLTQNQSVFLRRWCVRSRAAWSDRGCNPDLGRW
jgi:outer membrane receptor for ferrienterochelin and colicin